MDFDQSNNQNPASSTPLGDPGRGAQPDGSGIVDAARSGLGSLTWKRFGVNGGIPAGVSKDHQWVADTIGKAGFGFGEDTSPLPEASQWADPTSQIPGWPVVDGPPRAGDVLAMRKGKPDSWYNQPGQQMGVATGNDTSIGIRNNNAVAESNWGFRADDAPTIRHHESLLADNTRTKANTQQPAHVPHTQQPSSPPYGLGVTFPPPEPHGLSPETRWKMQRAKEGVQPQGFWEGWQNRLNKPQLYPSDRH